MFAVRNFSKINLQKIAFVFTCLIPICLLLSRGLADVLLSLVAVIFLFHSYKIRDFSWTRDKVILALLMLWGWMVLVASPMAEASILDSLKSSFVWIRFIIFFAALKYFVLREARDFKILSLSIIATLCYGALDSIYQYFNDVSFFGREKYDGNRLTGPLKRPNIAMYFLKMMFLPLAFLTMQAWAQKNKKQLFLYGFLFFAFTGIIFISGQRAPLIFICLLCISFLAMTFDKKTQLLIVGAFLASLIFAGILIATQEIIGSRIEFLFAQISNFSNTDYYKIFEVAVIAFLENPIFGIGVKNYEAFCEANNFEVCVIHAHNIYLQILSACGISGLIIFSVFIFYFAKGIWAMRKNHVIFLSAAAIFIINFFPALPTQSIYSNWPAILFFYSIGLAYAAGNLVKR